MSAKLSVLISVLFCILLLSACSVWQKSAVELPPISKPSYLDLSLSNEEKFAVSLNNQLPVDRYVILGSEIDSVNTLLNTINPIQLSALDSISISLMSAVDSTSYLEIAESMSGSALIGNPKTVQADTTYLYNLPVGKGKSYRILQGQNGSFTHHQPGNRYAVDFAMSVGDTVYAVRDGMVAYLYEESTVGGNDPAYLPYSNSLLILHDDGTVANYSHLYTESVFVEIGDQVETGQPVALSGNTGYISGDHLHLNLTVPVDTGHVSIPFYFEGYNGRRFRKGDVVSH